MFLWQLVLPFISSLLSSRIFYFLITTPMAFLGGRYSSYDTVIERNLTTWLWLWLPVYAFFVLAGEIIVQRKKKRMQKVRSE